VYFLARVVAGGGGMISGWVLRMRVRGKKVIDPCMRGSGHSIGLEGGGGGAAILCGINKQREV
jgi:hypothetical protein